MSAVLEGWLPRHRFRVEEYSRMRSLRILAAEDRAELIEGKVLDFVPGCLDARDQAIDVTSDSWIPYHRFTVQDYYRMAEAGLLAADARVELIDGEIIDMTPIGSLHCGTVDWIAGLFYEALQKRAIVRTQGVVALDEYSEPQPDLMLLRPREDYYCKAHPGAPETFLIVEVSDSSLRADQRVKVPLFAHFGVPEVWIVDLAHECVHAYRSPREGGYQDVTVTANPSVMPLSALPGVTVDLSDLFQ